MFGLLFLAPPTGTVSLSAFVLEPAAVRGLLGAIAAFDYVVHVSIF
jgi:hypothetical protein